MGGSQKYGWKFWNIGKKLWMSSAYFSWPPADGGNINYLNADGGNIKYLNVDVEI